MRSTRMFLLKYHKERKKRKKRYRLSRKINAHIALDLSLLGRNNKA
jgi:hypothetical protein